MQWSIEYLLAIRNVKILNLLVLEPPGATRAVEPSRDLGPGQAGLRATAERPEQSSELEILQWKIKQKLQILVENIYIFNGIMYKCTEGLSRGIRGIAFVSKIKGSVYTWEFKYFPFKPSASIKSHGIVTQLNRNSPLESIPQCWQQNLWLSEGG